MFHGDGESAMFHGLNVGT